MNRIYVAFVLAASLAGAGLLFSAKGQHIQTSGQQGAVLPVNMVVETKAGEHPVSAVLGESWLKHLGLTVSQTHMGQMGANGLQSSGECGKPAPAASDHSVPGLKSVMPRFLAAFRTDPNGAEGILKEKFTVSGSDLYRWSCQSCHGPDGKGADPEINSVIGPVQGTSAKLAKDRMIARGIEADDDMVNQMSELAETSLRDRLQHGGKNMPAFDHLRSDEVEALIGYLEKLAGVPPTKRDGLVVQESAARAGEHIVRGTCHVCHDATGRGTGMMMHGAIPSLASMAAERSLSGVVHQVRYGSSGTMRMMGADQMPAFPYFTEEEIAAAYFAAAKAGQ